MRILPIHIHTWVKIREVGATGAIAPPKICKEELNIAQAPQENDDIASLP